MANFSSLLASSHQKKAKVFFKSRSDYESKLLTAQMRLLSLHQEVHKAQKKVVILFEGPDAAGKGGAIKRLTERLDPRGIRVHSVGPPDACEAGQQYLQRFFSRLPQPGRIAIFDRSWYGRVLVERVEKLCPQKAWKNAYAEINWFEKMLVDDGVLVLKYLLDLTHKEQADRFKERQENPFKAWKLTTDDWRNRKKWTQYHTAYLDLLRNCSPTHCEWTVVPADSKWYTRVSVLSNVADRLEDWV